MKPFFVARKNIEIIDCFLFFSNMTNEEHRKRPQELGQVIDFLSIQILLSYVTGCTITEKIYICSEIFFAKSVIFFTLCAEKVCYKVCNMRYKVSNTCYKVCNTCYKLCNKNFLMG